MASEFELGGAEIGPSSFDTTEMDAIRGGDPDTGVVFPAARDSEPSGGQSDQTPFPEGQEFPSQFDYGPD